VSTGGDFWYPHYDYYYFETTSDGRYLYGLVEKGSEDRLSNSRNWDVKYEPSDGKFYDVGSSVPYEWGQDDTGTGLTTFPTTTNLQTHYWYDSSDNFKIKFENPYYVA